MVHLCKHPFSWLICVFLSALIMAQPAQAQKKGKPAPKGKPKPKSATVSAPKAEPTSQEPIPSAPSFTAWINAGLAYNRASGNFFTQQEAFYQTGSDSFPGTMERTHRMAFTGGAHGLFRPFASQPGLWSHLGVWAGIQYLKKGFDTKFTMRNLEVPYTDQTVFAETFRASYLAPSLGIRLGSAYYVDLGMSYDLLLSGTWKRTISHTASDPGSGIIGGNYTTEVSANDSKLDSGVLQSGSLGLVAGLGAWIHPRLGARLGLQSNPRFFKNGADVQNLQLSFQVLFSIL